MYASAKIIGKTERHISLFNTLKAGPEFNTPNLLASKNKRFVFPSPRPGDSFYVEIQIFHAKK